MTCSRTDRFAKIPVLNFPGWVTGVAVAALTLPFAALAQEAAPPPQSILSEPGHSESGQPPSDPDIEPFEPQPAVPAEDEAPAVVPDEAAPDAEAAPAQPPKSVDVGTLDTMRLGGIGVISLEAAALPQTLWARSAAAPVTMRLLSLPTAAPSRVLQELEQRLLLVAAPPPETPDDRSDLDFISARLDRLAATGNLARVVDFFDRIGREHRHEHLTRLAIDAYLLTARDQDACAAASRSSPDDISADWLRLMAFCRALGGDLDGAGLALEMLAEQKAKHAAFDPLMAAFLKQVASGQLPGDKPGPRLKSLKGAPPLLLALARLTHAPLPNDVTSDAAPLVAAQLVQNPDLPLMQRLRLAERLAARGGYSFDHLREIYAAVPLKDGDIEQAAVRASTLPAGSGYANALLYQAAAAAAHAPARLALLQAGLKRAGADGTRMVYASVMAPFLVDIPPAGENLAAAGDVIRLYLLAGRIDAAEDWYAVLRRQAAVGNPEAARLVDELWPLMLVWASLPQGGGLPDGGAAASYSPEQFAAWVRTREDLPLDQRKRQVGLVSLLLSRAGYAVPVDWLPTGEAAGDTGFDLVILSREQRLGETILEAMKQTAPGLSQLTPEAVMTLGEALRSQGLDREARRLVTEIMVIQDL